MLDTLREICQEHWQWRHQLMNLAVFDLKKEVRGTAFRWVWLMIKPLMYIGVFWFALALGLRAGHSVGDYPYILWLSCGLIPWFFMQSMLNTGTSIYRRYPYLVNRMHFPMSIISTFYALAQFIVFTILVVGMIVLCILTGTSLDIHVLQVIPSALLMLVYFIILSMLTSPLCAISKDFHQLIKALTQPLFWLSGIIYNVSNLPIDWLQTFLAFNPITFFCTCLRASLCDKYWIWEKPEILVPFVVVFVATTVIMLYFYGKLRKDVADVL
ncbi:ABC transporter permease [Slackia heliotrinireducens]|uniref:ABC transporter permease n=1 Tax=Slackia heliotrinireducens TaxID=84110 RepID=UPI0033146490